ncbi:interleukin-7 receptor subunit alpha isoform X2 [Electrophorus electricus]|uniref:interleukin-7 receptor subunit alpha isoform X2 n=1 Tax=Electrophorus electricus TaxID=8005 RepID=UPI0015CFFB91|nr:interleukin-7 receptor subunit alpha isoform X2 [Electrophorus electricus]
MSYIFWIFSVLCPFLVHSESGDYDDPIFCSSTLTFGQNNLTCFPAAGDTDDIEFASLCSNTCFNGTLDPDSINFQNLRILTPYKLKTHFKEGEVLVQDINLVRIVKIPTPEIQNATYKFDEAIIYIKYKHDYVINPAFEVQIRGKSFNNVVIFFLLHISFIMPQKLFFQYHNCICLFYQVFKTLFQPVTISRHLLRDNEEYYVCARAKPIEYFNGRWTNWSPEKSFTVNTDQAPLVITLLYTLLCTSVILLVVIGLVGLRCKEIKALISPNIPHPKATLAQIHRLKEHPPVSFSPEMFNDVNINHVDYTEEMHLTPELNESHTAIIGCCTSGVVGLKSSQPASLSETQDGDDQRLEVEMSHLKIKLLDQSVSSDEGENHVGCQSLAALQRDYKDETYVTMSSLYKTQCG